MVLILFALGLVFGSFTGAQVWRLRARQLVEDKAAGEEVDGKEFRRLKPLLGKSASQDRSRCLECGHTLAWYDLLPLVSWISTGGKCRYCKKAIGNFEPAMEVGVGLYFTISYIAWPFPRVSPLEWALFALWLIAGVLFAILFAYDAKWFLLPDNINYSLIATGLLFALTYFALQPSVETATSIVGSIAMIAGLYWILYLVSKGEWVGFGDVKLGVGLGLLIADWQKAFLAVFLANFIGCIIVLIFVLMRREVRRHMQLPFGPMLIMGAILAVLWGESIMLWYNELILSSTRFFI